MFYTLCEASSSVLGKKTEWHYYVSEEKRDYVARNSTPFIEKNIHKLSKKCYTTEQLIDEFNSLQLDAVIVGSNQVWHPDYSPCQPNYFFDFISADSYIRRISYTASFGSLKIEGTSIKYIDLKGRTILEGCNIGQNISNEIIYYLTSFVYPSDALFNIKKITTNRLKFCHIKNR